MVGGFTSNFTIRKTNLMRVINLSPSNGTWFDAAAAKLRTHSTNLPLKTRYLYPVGRKNNPRNTTVIQGSRPGLSNTIFKSVY